MNIRTIIIEHKEIAQNAIKLALQQYTSIEVVRTFSDGFEAIDYINNCKPDVVFLNTKVKHLTGFEIIEKTSLDIKPLFVFISSYNEYAAKAFDYLVFDFILKPYSSNRFHKTVKNIISYKKKEILLNTQKNLENILSVIKQDSVDSKKITIKSGNKISFLNVNEIKYVAASGYYVEIFTEHKKHLLRESLSSLFKRLNSPKFIRIHRSTIVNSDFIEEIITSNYGENDVKIIDVKPTFRVSKSFKKEFHEFVGVK
ncbi:LytR/AlgR family response regulator transcription factor [Tenacibaculum amylolyticum]|uniref:LytR/AlgR family response regulator transcription factor n=1 Tax=Tenacibaculum amylolyticum TaxID=104269 RepID=UPI0038932EDB